MYSNHPLRVKRNQAGLSQYELARRAHVSEATIVNIERRHSRPFLSTLELLAKALKCSAYALTD